jgi:branched-chain amino acid transport system substrate-binding protein
LVFRTALSDAYKGQAMASYVMDSGIDTISVSFASDAYNSGVAKVFSQSFTKLGGTVAVFQAHQPERPDYQREVDALAAGSENLALFAYYGSSGTQLLKNVFSAGKITEVFGTDGLLSQEVIDELGADSLASTRIVNAAADETRNSFKIWQKMADDAGIPASGPFVANSYDAAFMMALAIEANQSADRKSISAGLRSISGPEGVVIYPGEFSKAKKILNDGGKINYDGASGVVDFDSNGDVSGFVSINSVLDGQWNAELLSSQ